MTKKPRKKLSRFKLIVIVSSLVIVVLFLFKPSFARYIYNGIKNYYYESQNFYFNCDKLSEDGAVLQLDNWDGVNNFPITFNMNSYKNNLVAANSNITYTITKNCVTTANVTCTVSKNDGLIPSNTHEDSFSVDVTPNEALAQGATVTLEVSVSSTSPYTKTLYGTVTLNVGNPGISYEITDKANQPYLEYKITNTLNYYRVGIPFGTYTFGQTLTDAEYNSLSASDKAKCASALIKLDFNPNVVLVDVTSDFYDKAYSTTTTMINNKQYINGITFGVDPVSSMTIRFYKANAANNYTYPVVNDPTPPVIAFTAL